MEALTSSNCCCCWPAGVYGLWSLSRDDVKRALRRYRDEALVRTALRELYAVADVDGTATGPNPSAGTDLVRSVTQRMFPGQGSNYTSVPGLSLGVGIGSGGGWGSGVGVGIGF